MNKEDVNFLNDIKNKMLTQDTVGQADPRFWVVMEESREYRVEDDEDGIQIYDRDSCDMVCEGNMESIYEWIKDQDFDSLKCDLNPIGEIEVELEDGDRYIISDAEDLITLLSDIGYSEYEIVKYRVHDKIAENTMFLTLESCKNHIKHNGYHYTKPRPYAMTAWRSPEVERLYKILQETNWGE